MPMYVILGKLTNEGAKNIQDLPNMLQENKLKGEKRGIKAHGLFLTQGRYDFVVLVEAPDDATMTEQTMDIARSGNSRSETLRAFPLEEMVQALQALD